MFEKILYPTDFSDVSKKALAYIMGMRKIEVKEVVVLHVIDQKRTDFKTMDITSVGKDVVDSFKYVNRKLEEDALNELKAIQSKLRAARFQVILRVERGIPKVKILQVEKEEDISAIVLGSHGKSNISEMLLGSVSEHVIRHCKKPVLVIKR